MSELTDVLSAISALSARGERMALATIVSVRGSTYRRPGARLLVRERGESVGNVSGGCLEGDVERIGRQVMATGEARLELFDLTAEGDEVWGLGLGCNGAMELFIEAATHALATADMLRHAIDNYQTCVLVTVLESPTADVAVGSRILVLDDGTTAGGLGEESLDVAALAAASGAMKTGASQAIHSRGVRLFVEVLQPPPQLIVCGAGHDAIPLVHGAADLGWRVTVADVRRAFLNRERFPEANDFLGIDPKETALHVRNPGRVYAILMTHNYLRDAEYLGALIDLDLPYLGLLGPRGRSLQLLRDINRVEAVDRIRAPAGLDIGSEGPQEVAVSILSELVAVHRGRRGGPLRDRHGPIHPAGYGDPDEA